MCKTQIKIHHFQAKINIYMYIFGTLNQLVLLTKEGKIMLKPNRT